ncbi:hypothetical protein XENOCAPTIV_014651 [Xenoophorus captivus]|uniref:PH domain-containing protein n=1 Tax=Xenoophorus captivus TaxID=1517983 RepID=A0ABV0SAG4_9TELE
MVYQTFRNLTLPISHFFLEVDAGLSFTKKELESSFVFDLRTEERTWYLVAESEEDMNRWVTSICLLCGFNPTDNGSESVFLLRSQSDRASMFEFSESFNTYFKMYNSLISISKLFFSSSRVHPGGPSDAIAERQDGNYVPMTPLTSSVPAYPIPATGDLALLGRQVPPPAHMGFRNSTMTPVIPSTPPLRRNTINTSVGEVVPPPIHRNLKPQRKGQGILVTRGDLDAPLEITPVSHDWQEVPPPVRSPVTRTFTRG